MAQSKGGNAPPSPPAATTEDAGGNAKAGAIDREQPTRPTNGGAPGVLDTVEYKPKDGVPLYEAGLVARENFSAVIGNKRVRVIRGAPADILPKEVVKVMGEYGCTVGTISREEFGLKPPVPTGGKRRANSSNERLPGFQPASDGDTRRDPGGY